MHDISPHIKESQYKIEHIHSFREKDYSEEHYHDKQSNTFKVVMIIYTQMRKKQAEEAKKTSPDAFPRQ